MILKKIATPVVIHVHVVLIITFHLSTLIDMLLIFIPSPTKLRRDIVTLPSFRNILVNTLESTSFNGF